jgi:tRNA dimethylallyltransferase
MTEIAPSSNRDLTHAAKPAVALIAGPTASGKSALALRAAEACNGVIINADASQVYADLSILSARPTPEDMRRAPHRLFGHVDGAESYSAARWAEEAKAAIAEAHALGQPAILAGGTGLYIRTLLDGIAPVPEIDPDIRVAVRAMAVGEAYHALQQEDPDAAARLNARDSSRVARALEVVRSTGRPLAHWQASRTGGLSTSIDLHPLILTPDRDWLIQRCDARFEAMMAAGAAEEVKALLDRKLPESLPVMRAIGVRPIAAWLADEIDGATMANRVKTDTRRYAKRQYTWFSHQPPAHWPRISETEYNDFVSHIVIKLP